MTVFLAAAALLLWCAALATGAWRIREFLDAESADDRRCDDVTALIPARNEADVIAACLGAVGPQVRHVVVVDDESTDDTAVVAGAAAGVELIRGASRPEGWSGKLWALQQGLDRVDTAWVLLLDADIGIDPGLVATLRERAVADDVGLLSLMARLPMQSLAERLLIPPFVYFFRLVYPFRRANAPGSGFAAAAGGCMLVRRTALEGAGAFASLHDAVIDDCTLAQRVTDAGFTTWIGLTQSARGLRGYAGAGAIWRMVRRTAFTQLRYSPWRLLACTLLLALMFWVAPVLLATGGAGWGLAHWLSLGAAGLMLWSFAPLLRFYGLPVLWALTLPVAATAYLAMTWDSALSYWRGIRSQWKDRTYRRDVVR